MSRNTWALYASLAILTSTALAADQGSLGVEVNGIPVHESKQPSNEAPKPVAREQCLAHCTSAETKCGSEVRRARAECSRNAANGGRNPYSGRTNRSDYPNSRDPYAGGNDYTYFCGYFEHPGRRCGSDIYSSQCQACLAHRYGLCIDALSYKNIGEMRYDCFRAERDAQNYCREELQDCKAACQ